MPLRTNVKSISGRTGSFNSSGKGPPRLDCRHAPQLTDDNHSCCRLLTSNAMGPFSKGGEQRLNPYEAAPIPNDRAALKCGFMAIVSLDPIGKGQAH